MPVAATSVYDSELRGGCLSLALTLGPELGPSFVMNAIETIEQRQLRKGLPRFKAGDPNAFTKSGGDLNSSHSRGVAVRTSGKHLDGMLIFNVSCHNQYIRRTAFMTRLLKRIQQDERIHFAIDDHEIEVVLVEKLLGSGQGVRGSNVVTLVSELLFEVFAYDQVVFQVQKATGCTLEKAVWITHEAHTTGRAVAYSGTVPVVSAG